MGRPVSLATKDRDLVDYYAIANMEVEVAQDFAEVQKQEIYHYCNEIIEKKFSQQNKVLGNIEKFA